MDKCMGWNKCDHKIAVYCGSSGKLFSKEPAAARIMVDMLRCKMIMVLCVS